MLKFHIVVLEIVIVCLIFIQRPKYCFSYCVNSKRGENLQYITIQKKCSLNALNLR
jgi:hypothetical protein